jgi:quercetin dioxygenase-like cupin family protein
VSAYEIRRIDELESIEVAGVNWRPIRRPLGITAVGMNAYTGAKGDHVVEAHSEESLGHEEIYVVVSGSARFTLDGEERDVEAGGLVYIREPKTQREAVALEDGTTVLAVGGRPGAHEPSAWEWWFAAQPYRSRGEYARGLELVREGLEAKPDDPARHFQVACYEAYVGNRDEALARLRYALERNDEMKEWARGHAAFESLRGDPEFLAIAGEPDAAGESA